MRLRVLTAILVLAAAVAGATAAAQAGGAKARGIKERAKAKTTLNVRRCETGDQPSDRLATFYGRMKPVRRTRRMMMRFVLVERSPVGMSPVNGPRKLSKWHRSRRGVSAFGYSQTVTGLQAGVTYRASVRYRWIGRGGKRLVSVRRRSAECRQDGDLPNLTVGRVTARSGLAAGTEIYSVPVRNTGKAAAESVKVDLIVDRASADAATIDTLGPGERTTVEISGPACRGRVRAVADPDDRIVETTEDDNSRRRRCPTVAP
jgi:hypothetical protein